MKEDAYELNELIEIPRGELLKLKEINQDLLEACRKSLSWLITLENSGMNYLTLPKDIELIQQIINKAEEKP